MEEFKQAVWDSANVAEGPGTIDSGGPVSRQKTWINRVQLHDGQYLQILWDEQTRIIGIQWKEATSAMTAEEFKANLILFASYVEQKKARGILVDVSRFRHKVQSDVQQWRVRNISTRYAAAGVQRFAFLFPAGAQIPPMMNQSAPEETFLTRGFDKVEEAVGWLRESRASK